ncbi:flagellar FliL protein [Alphaproteobacteria bacterium]
MKSTNLNLSANKDADSGSPVYKHNNGVNVESGEKERGIRRLLASRTLQLIILAVAIMLMGGGILYYREHKKIAQELAKQEELKKNELVFHDLNELIVNLDTMDKGSSFLKIKISLQLRGVDNLRAIDRWTPKIIDVIQIYLRELRPIDLHGSFGLYKLRAELVTRINAIVYPAKIEDVLFRDVLIQ